MKFRIYGEKPQKSEGQIEQEVLELRLASVRRNTAEEIFKELDKGIMPYEGFGAIIPASENSAYQKIKEKYLNGGI